MRVTKLVLASVIFGVSILLIGYLFWDQEVKYLLPTPVPDNYQLVYVNQTVQIGDTLSAKLAKPAFYHFFSTDCPCSKFNLTHFNWLKSKYGDFLDFYVVVPAGSDLSEARQFFRGETKLIEDKDKEFAIACGVYSTPQAVVLTTSRKLYYRGNYNKARYCTDPASNFAQMAIDSLMTGTLPPAFGPLSTIAYGCGLDEQNTLNELILWN